MTLNPLSGQPCKTSNLLGHLENFFGKEETSHNDWRVLESLGEASVATVASAGAEAG